MGYVKRIKIMTACDFWDSFITLKNAMIIYVRNDYQRISI